MRRFRFRLESLLRLRSQAERSSRRELAAAMASVTAVEQRIAAAAQGLRDCADQAREHGAKGLLARSLEMGLRRHEWRLQSDRQKAQKKADGARAVYIDKVRDVRTLQKLREQRHAEWRAATAKAEQAELDELARLGRAARDSETEKGRQP